MEQTVRKLNWIYYSQMVIAMIVLSAMYYAFSKGLYEPWDRMSTFGQAVQYIIIFDALITIPLGLYLVKLFKPKTDQQYFKVAAPVSCWRATPCRSVSPLITLSAATSRCCG